MPTTFAKPALVEPPAISVSVALPPPITSEDTPPTWFIPTFWKYEV